MSTDDSSSDKPGQATGAAESEPSSEKLGETPLECFNDAVANSKFSLVVLHIFRVLFAAVLFFNLS